MSTQVTTAFVQQFSSNMRFLAQQMPSRLRGVVRNESITGTDAYFDQIGSALALVKGARHSVTVQSNTPHARRKCSLVSYAWSDLIDSSDKVRMLADPTSMYAKAGMAALNRAIDSNIITAALGTANTGVAGGTAVTLPISQQIVASDGAAISKLNLLTLTKVREKLLAAEAVGDQPLNFVLGATQLMSLLNDQKVSSADYNSIKALVNGELNTYMGFNFIRSELLTVVGAASLYANPATGGTSATLTGGFTQDAVGYKNCFAFASDGVLLGLGQDIKAKISERDDLQYSTQVYAEMDIGATRMEEVKVVQVSVA